MKSSISRAMVAALLTASSSASMADDGGEAGQAAKAIAARYYVAPMTSFTLADSKRGTDNGIGGSLALGKQLSDGFALELSGVYTVYGARNYGDNSTKLNATQANVLFFPGQMNFYGLLGMGFGQVRSQPGVQDRYANSLWNVGMGYLLGPFDMGFGGVSLRMEALYRGDSHSDKQVGNSNNGAFREAVFNVGFLIPIGSVASSVDEPEQGVAVVPVVADGADSDGDGVADGADQCPGSAAGSAVGSDGCEASPSAAPVSDTGSSVEPASTAEADCKTPEPGQAVTEQGCAAPNRLPLPGIEFADGDAQLSDRARKVLDELADGLQASPNIHVEIRGYAKADGDGGPAQQLAAQRAQSVSEYLTGKGVSADRIAAVAAEADETAQAGVSASRVEITVLQ